MSDLLLLRADGGSRLGFGHVMRSLALAEGWQRSGGRALFAMAESSSSLVISLRARGIEAVRLDVVPGGNQDALRTVELALERRAACVVADGYGFGNQWQRLIKDAGLQLLLWDDYGHAEFYHADFILNQNLHASAEMYERREPYTRLLLGARYAQLRSEFLEWRKWKREIASIATRVLVTMGGSDPQNVTAKVLHALASVQSIEVVVVTGGSNPNIDELREIVAGQANVKLAVDVPNLAELMAWADFGVSAGGSTSLELAYMGLPAVIVPIAANQDFAAEALGNSDLMIAVLRETGSWNEQLAESIRALHSASREKRTEMSRGLRRLVDGKGRERVVRSLKGAKVTLRSVSHNDCALLWQWANDSAVRSWSFSSSTISWDDHVRWFESKCEPNKSIWYIACDQPGRPVGQVRIDLDSPNRGIMNISVAPEHRGRGMATSMLCAALEDVFGATAVHELHAYVKPGNTASLRLFEQAGFTNMGVVGLHTNPAVHFVCKQMEAQVADEECSSCIRL